MFYGTVVTASNRGFWFIERDDDHRSIFCHQRNVLKHRYLHVGERVRFDTQPSKTQPDDIEAIHVEVIPVTIAVQRSAVVRP
jgi:cold shock CspA family protein